MKIFTRVVSFLNLLATAIIFIAMGVVVLVFKNLSLPAFPLLISEKDINILFSCFLLSFSQLLYLHLIIKKINKQKDEPFNDNAFNFFFVKHVKSNLLIILFIILNVYFFNVVYQSIEDVFKVYKYSVKSSNILFLAYGFYLLEKIFYLFVITINILFCCLSLFKKYCSNNYKKKFAILLLLISTIPFYIFGFIYYKDYKNLKNLSSCERVVLSYSEKLIFDPPPHYIYTELDPANNWPYYKEIELTYCEKLLLTPPPSYIRVELDSIKLKKILNREFESSFDFSREKRNWTILAVYAKNKKQYKKILENVEDNFLFCTYDCLDGLAVIYRGSDLQKFNYYFSKDFDQALESDKYWNKFQNENLFYESITNINYSQRGTILLSNREYSIVSYFTAKNQYHGDYSEYQEFNKRWMDALTAKNPSVEIKDESKDEALKYLFKLAPNVD